jgi:hypothetical protein
MIDSETGSDSSGCMCSCSIIRICSGRRGALYEILCLENQISACGMVKACMDLQRMLCLEPFLVLSDR